MNDPAVSVKDVTVRFDRFIALQDVSLEVADGAFVSIIGPNGAGKSTLLRVVLGLLRPQVGNALLFGATPGKFPSGQLGYIPQLKTMDRSFPALAIELVVTGLRARWPWRITAHETGLAMEAMAKTGVADVAGRSIAKLSGGELQRVYLARTLVRRPRLMVLDEPAAGMDVRGEADMYHILGDYQRETGATVIMITHDWEGARVHASHVLLLNRRVVAFGPPADVAREENLLALFGHSGHVHATHQPAAAHSDV